jgi:hypothetical protein
MIDEADPHGGLARAALVLTTAIIAEVRRNRLTAQQARRIFQQARFLVDDRESFAATKKPRKRPATCSPSRKQWQSCRPRSRPSLHEQRKSREWMVMDAVPIAGVAIATIC